MEVFIFGWWWRSHQSLAHKGLRILRFGVMSWKGERKPKSQTVHGKTDWSKWFKSSREYRALEMEFEWNIFPGFTTLELCTEVQELLWRLSVTPEKFTGRIILVSMFNDISWWSKDNKKERESSVQLVSLYAKRFGAGQRSFLGPGSEKKWYSFSEDSPQGEWDRVAEQMMIKFAESGHPIFRATSPLSRGVLKSKGGKEIVDELLRCPGNDWNCFSHNYLC